jgi:acyl-CoA dehydrogenase
VPYGRLATTVAAGSGGSGGDGDWLAVIAPAGQGGTGRGGTGRNLAGEPRDEVILGGDTEVHGVPAGTADYARRLLRLFRSLLIAGAAQRALDLTVTYVQEREQFGRPLARFPTVQQELARMAGEVALTSAATQAAVGAERPGAGEGVSAVVAAKAQASSGAGIVAAIAHQLHGAIGTTEEHRLRLTTTRLWSWRDEDGSEAECFAELGRAALAAATGARAESGIGAGTGAWAGLAGSGPGSAEARARDLPSDAGQPNRSTTVLAPVSPCRSLRPTTSMWVRQCRSASWASPASTRSTSLR